MWPPLNSTMCCALGTSDVALLEAAGADVHLLLVTVNNNSDMLNVRTELTIGYTVRVADRTTSNCMLTADSAYFRHIEDLHVSGVCLVRFISKLQ